jgi:hypothetical protein
VAGDDEVVTRRSSARRFLDGVLVAAAFFERSNAATRCGPGPFGAPFSTAERVLATARR